MNISLLPVDSSFPNLALMKKCIVDMEIMNTGTNCRTLQKLINE